MDCSISWHLADASKESLSWLLGSDVVVVDPPCKGLDSSLVSALRSLSFMKLKNNISESKKAKNEKRPWVLLERETSGQSLGQTMDAKRQSLPETLIYISCGWDSFKEILIACHCYPPRHGIWRKPMVSTFSLEQKLFKRGAGETVNRKKTGKKKRRA